MHSWFCLLNLQSVLLIVFHSVHCEIVAPRRTLLRLSYLLIVDSTRRVLLFASVSCMNGMQQRLQFMLRLWYLRRSEIWILSRATFLIELSHSLSRRWEDFTSWEMWGTCIKGFLYVERKSKIGCPVPKSGCHLSIPSLGDFYGNLNH